MSYILVERLAPVQQSLYYTTPSMTEDGRFLWIGCGFPPPGGRHSTQVLAVVDFEDDEMRIFPETQFPSSRPCVDVQTGEVYWANQLDIWKRGPKPAEKPVLVNRFPKELARGRPDHIASHMTLSADRKALNIDARFYLRSGGGVGFIGDLPLDGAPFRLWQEFETAGYDHAMFSPTDPAVQLFAHEFWHDHAGEPFDGLRPYHRMWLIRRGENARPVLKAPVSHSGHEWWDPDGNHVWYVHYGVGVKKVAIATSEEWLRWPGALSHAHSDRSGRYLVADRMDDPGLPDCHVIFRDTIESREIEIVNRPPLAAHFTQCGHLHPHPNFCCGDRYICHTTTINDRVDVALINVPDLIARLA